MAEDRLTIDAATIEDNTDQRQVEFDAEVSGERYRFALQYDVLEALAAATPVGDAGAIFRAHSETIAIIGVRALARDGDQERITISENDLD
jgi:hypothetical protein